MSAADAPASPKARQRLVLRLQELGAPSTEDQRHVCAVWTRGRARTRRELTEAEAGSLYARLREMTADDLARVLAAPVPPAAEPTGCPVESGERSSCPYPPGSCCMTGRTAPPEDTPGPAGPDLSIPAGTITCGGPLTEHDAAELRAFGAFLETAGPPPAISWETLTAEDPPAPPSPTAEAEAIEQRGEPIEPTPVDVEAAARAAVERFRARRAAGVVPEPPDLVIAPRQASAPRPAAGRYCLARCYCGTCPQYAEQAEAAERAYRQELTAARNRNPRADR